MVRRRFMYCGIAAAFLASGPVLAQDPDTSGLKPSLAQSDLPDEAETPVAIPLPPATAKATALEITPLPEPPTRLRKRRVDDDPHAALGLDLGGLTLFPVLRVGVVASDNPASVNSNRKGDIGLRLRPSLRIVSDWVRHELTIDGAGDFIAYADNSENDADNASTRGSDSMSAARRRSPSMRAIGWRRRTAPTAKCRTPRSATAPTNPSARGPSSPIIWA